MRTSFSQQKARPALSLGWNFLGTNLGLSMTVENLDSGAREMWVQIPALPLTSCVASHKFLSLSVQQFLPHEVGPVTESEAMK